MVGVTSSGLVFWLKAGAVFALFATLFVFFFYLIRSLPRRRKRWPLIAIKRLVRRRSAPVLLLRLFGLSAHNGKLEDKERLLLECGWRFNPLVYELSRRLAISIGGVCAASGYIGMRYAPLVSFAEPVYVLTAGMIVVLVLGFDRTLLQSIGKYRTHNVMKDIYALSTQLLYYNGSKMSLHTKLTRCLPFCRTIRADMQLLLNEWYEDAEQAIKRFKRRLGTEEAYSFSETINSLRLNESDSYYTLLRDRIQDYKEKLDLAKESRKETTSYVLFVLAGIPILNTFRIFAYPWVQEGQKLFDSLN
ncbi:MAG: hypothetical protein K0Q59_2613 [Paenibacillus sp.]|nr:hypothetical protein [Paenibacillus sp.]